MTVTHPKIHAISKRWKVAQFPDAAAAVGFAVKQFCDLANQAIDARGQFAAALSGGSTPAAIYRELAKPTWAKQVDWSKVMLFWSDERAVPPDHPDSNYRMAMEAGLEKLDIPEENIFRMQAEADIEVHAAAYDHLLKEMTGGICDLVMLGMGEDGHTASLFPETEALRIQDRLVTPNRVPKLNAWRMTFTYPCINSARNVHVYVLGQKKQKQLKEVLTGPPDRFPIQGVGTAERPALWITDCSVLEAH